MLFVVDPRSTQPIYEQVAGCVRRALREGDLELGDRLPPAKEVAQSLEVNLHTVLRAYQQLRDDGLIDVRRGRRAVVVGTHPAGLAAVRDAAHSLVAHARTCGMDRAEVVRLLEEEWS